MNHFPGWICQFLWCAVIRVISDHYYSPDSDHPNGTHLQFQLDRQILGCVPLTWSTSGSVIRDHLDHGRSNEPMNPCPEWIHQFIWSTMTLVISDHWSWSSQRNAPLEKAAYENGRSNEPMNPCPEWTHQFIWSTMIRVISAHWSWSGSSQRNAPLEKAAYENTESILGDPGAW